MTCDTTMQCFLKCFLFQGYLMSILVISVSDFTVACMKIKSFGSHE